MAKLYLNPVEFSDLESLKNWRNNEEIMSRTREWKMLSSKNQENWFNSLYNSRYPENIMYTIDICNSLCDTDTDDIFANYAKTIGCCGLCYIDYINRSAEVSIYIGNKSDQKKGFATQALNKLMDIAQNNMNLRRVFAEIYDFNEPSIRLFSNLGFEKEATLKRTVFKNGKWCDSYFYTYFF